MYIEPQKVSVNWPHKKMCWFALEHGLIRNYGRAKQDADQTQKAEETETQDNAQKARMELRALAAWHNSPSVSFWSPSSVTSVQRSLSATDRFCKRINVTWRVQHSAISLFQKSGEVVQVQKAHKTRGKQILLVYFRLQFSFLRLLQLQGFSRLPLLLKKVSGNIKMFDWNQEKSLVKISTTTIREKEVRMKHTRKTTLDTGWIAENKCICKITNVELRKVHTTHDYMQVKSLEWPLKEQRRFWMRCVVMESVGGAHLGCEANYTPLTSSILASVSCRCLSNWAICYKQVTTYHAQSQNLKKRKWNTKHPLEINEEHRENRE